MLSHDSFLIYETEAKYYMMVSVEFDSELEDESRLCPWIDRWIETFFTTTDRYADLPLSCREGTELVQCCTTRTRGRLWHKHFSMRVCFRSRFDRVCVCVSHFFCPQKLGWSKNVSSFKLWFTIQNKTTTGEISCKLYREKNTFTNLK